MMHPAETHTTRDLVRGHTTLGEMDLTILTDGTVSAGWGRHVRCSAETLVGEARAGQ